MALTPLEYSEKADQYAHVKEKWLLEKYLLDKQIEKSNSQQEIVQMILGLDQK